VVGAELEVIVTSLAELVQEPFPIVQRKTLAPLLSAETVVVPKLLFAKVAAPETTDQVPIPVTGIFPSKVAVVEQIVWLVPATEAVGGVSIVIVI
jgi:hypothetical protein